jgi:amino acid adenylation domain-containing protein
MKYNILDYFQQSVINNGNKKAIIDGENNISFLDLDLRAKILANILNDKVDFINKPIAVFLPKSINSVIANIAITFSANAYMNLDIKTPIDRIKNILKLISPTIIITNTQYLVLLKDITNDFIIVNIDEVNFNIDVNDLIFKNRLDRIIDIDPLCIINTSGSTGTPKGVVLNHRSFIEFTEWALRTFDFSHNEIIGSLSPIVFDIYSFELCLLMSRGATLVLISDSLSPFPIKILNILELQKVTFIFWVPTIMVNISNMNLLTSVDLNTLKIIWFAGEVFPTKQFNYWKQHLSHSTFANLYGPIEITLDCTYFIVDRDFRDDEPLPIGKACKNTDILILNDDDKLVIQGEEGELCVRGTSLAMGYYNNPEKTSAAFVQNPLNKSYPEIIYRTGDIVSVNENNEILFKGRKDSLIKHLGYRIELGEIEHVVVNTLNLAKNVCVVYQYLKKEITMYYESDAEIPVSEFRKKIGTTLPRYMIPSTYIRLDLLPRNTNGKIDRLYLKEKTNS